MKSGKNFNFKSALDANFILAFYFDIGIYSTIKNLYSILTKSLSFDILIPIFYWYT